MSHVDDGQLNALLDGELSADHGKAVEAHLASCAECRARLEEARAFLMEANALLDAAAPPTPRQARDALVARAAAPAVGGLPPRRTSVTAKEKAIDIDGATQKSPAIVLPPRPQAAPAASRPAAARRFPVRNFAWAASVVLMFAVGWLARDVNREAPAARAAAAPQPLQDTGRKAVETVARAPAQPPATQAAPRAAAHQPPAGPAARQPARRPATSVKRLAPALVPAPAPRPRPTAGAVQNLAGVSAGAPLAAAPAAPAAAGEPRADARQAAAGGVAAANAPSPAARARAAEADLLAERPRAAVPATRFVRVPLDTAVVRLQGTIRLIDGLRPVQVEIGPGSLVDGAARGLDVVRIAYTDPEGRGLVLQQQRIPAGADAASLGMTMLYGDTIVTTAPGLTRMRWLDNRNFWLSLQGPMSADSLRAFIDRLR